MARRGIRKTTLTFLVGVLGVISIIGMLNMLGYISPLSIQPQQPMKIEITTPTPKPGEINPEILGTSATVTVNVYDIESDDNSELSTVPLGVYLSDGTKIKDADTYNSSDTFSVSVGSVIGIYGGKNGTSPIYLDFLERYRITDATPVISIDGATGVSESDLQITCYDDSMDKLSTWSAVNHTFPDYNISLGADAVKTIYCKLKNNVADKRYDLKAVCIGYINDIRQVTLVDEVSVNTNNPVGSGTWRKTILPLHISDTSITDGNLGTDYDVCFERDDVLKLSQWDDVLLQFEVTAKSNGCAVVPASTVSNTTMDVFYIQFKDAGFGEKADGSPGYGFYKQDNDESDAGLDESDASPQGRTSGVLIGCEAP